MNEDLVRCRTERKFLLRNSVTVRTLAAAMRAASGRPDLAARNGWISTVYFDRPDGSLTRWALRCPQGSVKVRLREYFTDRWVCASPFAWIEVKERDGATSRKSRFQLHKRLVGPLLRGELGLDDVLSCRGRSSDPDEIAAAFARVREEAREGPLDAVGAVSCHRLSLEGGEPAARLTLDRRIRYHAGPAGLYDADPALVPETLGQTLVEETAAVMELKHRNRALPSWVRELIGEESPSDYSKFAVLARLWLPRAADIEEAYVD